MLGRVSDLFRSINYKLTLSGEIVTDLNIWLQS